MSSFLTYYSVRFIEIRNRKLAILHLVIQAVIIGYVVIGSVVLAKGYQAYDQLTGTTVLKVKGTASTGGYGDVPITIFDAADLVVPPTEQNALFVTTNYIVTPNQTRSVCEGNDPTMELCYLNVTNPNGGYQMVYNCNNTKYTYNGLMTGDCGPSGVYCNLRAWCPLENDTDTGMNWLTNVKDWTVFIKVNGQFPAFGESVTNAPQKNPIAGTNLFTIESMVNMAGSTYDSVQDTGCVILIILNFQCNLNTESSSDCSPTYTWVRIDDLAPGYNFRYVNRFTDPQSLTEYRTEWKVYGTRFIFQVFGVAGRFSLPMLVTTLGGGLALLGVSTLICDFVLLYFLPSRKKYLTEKFEEVDEPINSASNPEDERVTLPIANTDKTGPRTSYTSLEE